MKRSYKLPDESWTNDVDEYVDAWKYLAAPIESILGWRIRQMNPGYAFEDLHGQRANLTVSQVRTLIEKLPRKCGFCGQEDHTSSCYERKLNAIRKALDEIDDCTACKDRIREVLDE